MSSAKRLVILLFESRSRSRSSSDTGIERPPGLREGRLCFLIIQNTANSELANEMTKAHREDSYPRTIGVIA